MTSVAVEERLFSLVLALLASESGLTKAEILSSVQGYRQRYAPGGDNASLERQFERDKDDIRELGVPLETIEAPLDPGNNQNLRYRISKGDYDLPADIAFTAQETMLLTLAAMVWREGSLSGESRRAIIKLRSLGVEADESVLGYAPLLRVREAAFEPLGAAIERRRIVSFPYLKPGMARARTRTVAPLALVQHQGRWHISGIDQDAGEDRTFLLSRIVGEVRITSRQFDPPPGDRAADTLAELDRLLEANVAELEVVPGTDAATRLGKRAESADATSPNRLGLHYTDGALLADELASYGPEVLVIGPPRLRSAVRSRLFAVAAAHGEGAGANG